MKTMLELVNLSNYASDVEIIQNDAGVLRTFLDAHNLDGLEMMFCNCWDNALHPKDMIKGAHLHFWPNWLDFWLGDKEALLAEFGGDEAIKDAFGGMKPENLLEFYRKNIETAINAEASYLVFHVSQARVSEIFCRRFYYKSEEVIGETINLLNELISFIPPDVTLLFENLWWPGLTLLERDLVEKLMTNVRHPAKGIMLDTGHLMNTNHSLKTQQDGVAYVLETLKNLGDCRSYIYGMHLHYSLSGKYVKKVASLLRKAPADKGEIMRYILRVDQHLPFTLTEVIRIVDIIRPRFLVHEFMFESIADLSGKVAAQRAALGYK